MEPLGLYEPPQQYGMSAMPQLEVPDFSDQLADTLAGEFSAAMSEIDMNDFSAQLSPQHEDLFRAVASKVRPKTDVDEVAQAAKMGIPPEQFAAQKRFEAYQAEMPVRLNGILTKHEADVQKLSDEQYKKLQDRLAQMTQPKAPQMEQYAPSWQDAVGTLLATAFGGTQAGNTAAGASMQMAGNRLETDYKARMAQYEVQMKNYATAIKSAQDDYEMAVKRGDTAAAARFKAEVAILEKEGIQLAQQANNEITQNATTQRNRESLAGRVTIEDMEAASRSALQEAGFDFKKPLQDAQIADTKSKTKERETLLPSKVSKALAEGRFKDAQTEYQKANTMLAKARTNTELGKAAIEGQKLEIKRGELNRRIASDMRKVAAGQSPDPQTASKALDMAVKLGGQIARLEDIRNKKTVDKETFDSIGGQIEFLNAKMKAYYEAADTLQTGSGEPMMAPPGPWNDGYKSFTKTGPIGGAPTRRSKQD